MPVEPDKIVLSGQIRPMIRLKLAGRARCRISVRKTGTAGRRVAMRNPVDELLIALSRGLEGWMLGKMTDAVEIASFADTTGNRAIPRTPEAVEQLLEDMVNAGLVEHQSRQVRKHRWSEVYSAYGLTEQGWRRAREIAATEQQQGPESEPPPL